MAGNFDLKIFLVFCGNDFCDVTLACEDKTKMAHKFELLSQNLIIFLVFGVNDFCDVILACEDKKKMAHTFECLSHKRRELNFFVFWGRAPFFLLMFNLIFSVDSLIELALAS